MKKQVLIACMFAGIIGCSSNSSPNYYKASNNVLEIPSSTIISAHSMNNFPMPENNQAVVELEGFKIRDDIYDASGERVIIPKNAVISGLYNNNGQYCEISWKSVYMNEKNFKAKKAPISVLNLIEQSVCEPTVAIKKGNVINIKFK